MIVDGNVVYIIIGIILGAFIGFMCKKNTSDDLDVRFEIMKRDILIEQLKEEIGNLKGE